LTAAETLAAPSESTSPKPQAAAERRQLKVMFCDLVGSTALSARFDPEELREEIRAYQNTVSAIAARYDSFVAKFMGDGMLAYFGYPRAHEDDAERAVRAGLEIEAAVTSLETRGTARQYNTATASRLSSAAELSRKHGCNAASCRTLDPGALW
jgi:class 3 adenylate cyclase